MTYDSIFIDYDVCIENDIIPFIQFLDQKKNIVYLDIDIKSKIKSIQDQKEHNNYYQAIEVIHYIESNHQVEFVDTKNYLSFSELNQKLNSSQRNNLLFITQQIQTAKAVNQELSLKNVQIVKYSKTKAFETWNISKNVYKDAFYTEDHMFNLNVSTEEIKHVYAEKFGYLDLLGEPLAKGGEGLIYKTYHNMIAKIFFNKHLSYMNFKKIQTMLTFDIHNPFIIWPIDILYYKNTFVGYLMPEVVQSKSIDELRDLGFPGYSIKQRFEIGLEFLKHVDYLHDRNIIVGDMKFDNIMVRNSSELYFVDTGSFQVEDYPCPVFLKEFTGRVFTTDDLKKTLRSFDDEYFPINKILFEIFMLKNPFYSKDSIEIDVNAPRVFHYPLDKNKVSGSPTNDMIIWFNLTENMREFFYYYFVRNKITPLKTWIDELTSFLSKK
jgi:serine/threonine protein kinase